MALRGAALAYHEAGHAVIGVRLGLRLKHVTIQPSLATYGLAHFKCVQAEDFEKRAITTIAGLLAEKKHLGLSSNLGNSAEYRSLISDRGGQAQAWRNLMRKQARELVNARWIEIEKVAAALLERETLTGQQVWKIICDRLGRKGSIAPALS